MHNLVPWILIGAIFCSGAGLVLQLVALIMMIWG